MFPFIVGTPVGWFATCTRSVKQQQKNNNNKNQKAQQSAHSKLQQILLYMRINEWHRKRMCVCVVCFYLQIAAAIKIFCCTSHTHTPTQQSAHNVNCNKLCVCGESTPADINGCVCVCFYLQNLRCGGHYNFCWIRHTHTAIQCPRKVCVWVR